MLVRHIALTQQVDVLGVLLREAREVVPVLDKLLGACPQLVDADEVVVHHQVSGGVHADIQHVAFLHVNLSILLILFRRLGQATSQTHIRIHRSGHQEENQQDEGDVGC